MSYQFRYLEHTYGMDNIGYAYFGTTPRKTRTVRCSKSLWEKEMTFPGLFLQSC